MPSAAHSPAVLVVDDEAAVLTVVRRALENTGYRVLAADAGEALQFMGSVSRDVAVGIVDCGVDCDAGSDLAVQLRRLAPGMRILMTSGRPAETLLLAPGTRFLAKPFTPLILRQAVLGEILAYEAERVMGRAVGR